MREIPADPGALQKHVRCGGIGIGTADLVLDVFAYPAADRFDPGVSGRKHAELALRHAHQQIRLAVSAGIDERDGFHRQGRDRRLLNDGGIAHHVVQSHRRAVRNLQRARIGANAHEAIFQQRIGELLEGQRRIERQYLFNDQLVLILRGFDVEDEVAGLHDVVGQFVIDAYANHLCHSDILSGRLDIAIHGGVQKNHMPQRSAAAWTGRLAAYSARYRRRRGSSRRPSCRAKWRQDRRGSALQ